MHNLGLGGLEFSDKHTLDQHRPDGYKMPDFISVGDSAHDNHHHSGDGDDGETYAEALSTTSTQLPTTTDDHLIKLIHTLDDAQQEHVFRTMHDPSHRHPRHRGKSFNQIKKNSLT